MDSDLSATLAAARRCVHCADHLPLGPRPVLVAEPGARIAVIGQAPGTRVHASGVPWDDASGDHLREWLAVDRQTFLHSGRFAILPMGLCYPGRKGGGDAPPRPECAPMWHPPVLAGLPDVRLTLLIGLYAQRYYLGPARRRTLTDTVAAFREYAPAVVPLPHPSWRSRGWIRRHPWFTDDLLPALRLQVATLVQAD